MASRVAGSQLRAAGLPELVTSSLAEYETLARRLATKPALLHSYRERLVANRQAAPLFDVSGYARGFAEAVDRLARDHPDDASD
jgi:predicted O-linked N-acetylglucosamine transferase (SPINDLY family)